MIRFFRKLLVWIGLVKPMDALEYWAQRADRLGGDAVLNVNNIGGDLDALFNKQIREIFPYLKEYLNGNEKNTVDFGCGTGRFSVALSELTNGKVIGFDPTESLLKLAPKSEHVEYKVITDSTLPLADNSVDVLFICLVLGCIQSDIIRTLAVEFNRVLRKGGIMCLVENTEDEVSTPYYFFRSVEEYIAFFPFVNLRKENEYFDCDEEISVLIGYKI